MILKLNRVSKEFVDNGPRVTAVKDISFELKRRQFVSILGPSGCGKSTLLRMLAGLLQPSSGTIEVQGSSLKEPRDNIGFVFQRANLMPWRTVEENIGLPMEVKQMAAEKIASENQKMIKLVGLEGFEDSYPKDLSGGMAQRVSIARALIQKPDLLLLDEPFGSLDALTRERMGVELLRIWQSHKNTVVMVTHNIIEALLLSDRILVLSDRPGRIIEDLIVEFKRPRLEEIQFTSKFGEYAKHIRSSIRINHH